MGKIKLAVEDLQVETFVASAEQESRGTVVGREGTEHTDCWGLCGESGALGCGGNSANYSECCTDPYERACFTLQAYGCQTREITCECNTADGRWTCWQGDATCTC